MTSATTNSADFGPQDWAIVLQNALHTPLTSENYAKARRVALHAVRQLNAADSAAAAPGAFLGATQALGNGLALGLPNALDPQALQYAQAASAAHPTATGVAGGTGRLATTTIATMIAPILGLGATSAVQGATADPDIAIGPEGRAISSVAAGTIGAAAGAGGVISTRLIGRFLPVANKVAKTVMAAIGKKAAQAAPKEVASVSEAAIRAQLEKMGAPPEVVERTVQAWKTGKIPEPSSAKPTFAPPSPVAVRPGETVTPTKPNPLDALRALPDAALGKTPPLAQSAAAPGVTETRAASAMRRVLGGPEVGSDLLPQDRYASTADLKSLLKMGKKFGITGEYADAIRKELTRRAKGIFPPSSR